MTNPYEEQQPPAQPSSQTPYPPSGQYQQPAGQPSPPYGQQSPMPYGGQPYGAPPQEHPQGTLILIFGILGIFITIFAPIAWYLGNKARAEIQASGIHYSNEQNVSIGRMLGKIFTIIAIVSIALVIIFWIIVAIAASQS
ncbi:MAG TPA: hypothetical protein VFH20_11065 [Propionibacteriaceae bacterium]|nr:hypothetical protein [Propionibacteriaceae bacterium]